MFCVYPPLEMVHLLFSSHLVIQECLPLVVISPLHLALVMSVPPLEVNQVCSGGIETWLQVVLCLSAVFTLFLIMAPKDLDVVMPPVILQQPERHDHQKT